MKKYNFKLETVLTLRKNIEEEWEAKLGKANGECQLIINRIAELNGLIVQSREKTTDISGLRTRAIYEDRLKQQISNEEKLLKEKEAERDEIQKVFIKKSIDRKIIDKLKEKSLNKYKKEYLKYENHVIDEINNSSGIRKEMLGGAV